MIQFLSPMFIAFFLFITEEPVVNQEIPVCSSPAGAVAANVSGKFMSAMKGWGDLNYPITTKVDSAQFYFNQGLSLYYGYHFTESLASFKEATRFDPSSAMTYWGQALAMGPFYNTYVYKMPKDVPAVVASMLTYATNVSEKERALIAALQKRYSNDLTNSDRKELDKNYENALASLRKKYPDDANIKALYVDAVMLEHKWDFWNNDGTPRPWTQELVSICEDVLKKENHPAIMHYYIHVTEASREPGRALSAADQLKDQLPSVPHMVHMSSHMYQRNGLYSRGVKVNEDAHNANNNMDTNVPWLNLGKNKSIHYYAVQSYCAMTAGMYEKGVPIYDRAREKQAAMPVNMEKETYPQFVYMMPVMARVRLGKWDEILKMQSPNEKWTYAVALDNFAKGMAYARKNDLKSAEQAREKLAAVMTDPIMKERYMPFNSPLQSCNIALQILTAEINLLEGKTDEALEAAQLAIKHEDDLVYREPQDWLIPARQYLGAYLLKANRAAEAEKIYREDLVMNPGNGWSLLGMHQSLKQQGKAEAADYEAKYKKAFADSDVNPTASVF